MGRGLTARPGGRWLQNPRGQGPEGLVCERVHPGLSEESCKAHGEDLSSDPTLVSRRSRTLQSAEPPSLRPSRSVK